MNIKKIISKYHEASESEKLQMDAQIEKEFFLLSEEEKKEVQGIFLESWAEVIRQGKEIFEK